MCVGKKAVWAKCLVEKSPFCFGGNGKSLVSTFVHIGSKSESSHGTLYLCIILFAIYVYNILYNSGYDTHW